MIEMDEWVAKLMRREILTAAEVKVLCSRVSERARSKHIIGARPVPDSHGS